MKLPQSLKSPWIFPLTVFLALLTLTALSISGTSSSLINRASRPGQVDPNLILGKPRDIRSDEWEVLTQLTKAQAAVNYPRYNENIGLGNDVSVVMDVPYREWSIVFRPQNIIFFILPFDNAFAFKWWFLYCVLLISSYLLCLHFLPRKYGLSALYAMCFALSPFIMWWFLTITIGTFAFGITALLLLLKLVDRVMATHTKDRREQLVLAAYTLGLAYSLVCFALVLYPPFQIPVAIVCACFGIAYIFSNISKQKLPWRKTIHKLTPILLAILLALSFFGLFIYTRIDAIRTVESTAYPGVRVLPNGGASIIGFFTGIDAPQLLFPHLASNYYTNQSEASMFMYFGIYLAPLCIAATISNRNATKRHRLLLMGLVLSALLLLQKFYIPSSTFLSEALLLTKSSWERTFAGFGILSFLFLIYWSSLPETKVTSRTNRAQGWLVTANYSVVMLWASTYLFQHYPAFIGSRRWLLLLTGTYILIFVLFQKKYLKLAALVWLTFSLLSSAPVNPLYRGSAPTKDDPVINAIRATGTHDDVWAVSGNILLENFPAAAGRRSITGVSPIPNLSVWNRLYPNEHKSTYNRYAHILLVEDTHPNTDLVNPQADILTVDLSCSANILSVVDYILSSYPHSDKDCLELKTTINSTSQPTFIYKNTLKNPSY